MLEVEKPDLGHRRHAIQIVAQLPETQAEALLILQAAKEFVLEFLAVEQEVGGSSPPNCTTTKNSPVVPA